MDIIATGTRTQNASWTRPKKATVAETVCSLQMATPALVATSRIISCWRTSKEKKKEARCRVKKIHGMNWKEVHGVAGVPPFTTLF